MNKKPKIIAVIPAYNEEKTIAAVILETEKHVNKIIVVDDGSTDHTAEIARRMGATVISHPKNIGKGAALRTGFKEALKHDPDIIITLDADLQHNPNEIPKLIQPIIEGKADMTIGSRYIKGGKMDAPLYRRIGLAIINKLHKTPIKDTQSGYRAYNRKAAKIVLQTKTKGYGIETEQIQVALKNKIKVVEVPTTIKYRGLEQTHKKHPTLHAVQIISTLIKMIAEEHPLLCIGLPGVIFISIGIVTGTYLIWVFNTTRYFSIPLVIIAVGASLIGLILATTALIIHVMLQRLEVFLK